MLGLDRRDGGSGLKGQGARIDEFAFVLLAGFVLILILTIAWGTLSQGPVTVSPTEKLLTIARGDSKDFTLRINGTAINVSMQARGEIASWISFDRNNFDATGSTDVEVIVTVPPTIGQGIYDGTVEVVTGNNKQTVDVKVEVSSTTVDNIVKNVRLGDFTVSYSVGSETIGEKSDFEVSKGYFSDYPSTIVATMGQDKLDITTGVSIIIDISETNNVGNLVVQFNGQQVYNDRAPAGELIIPIDKSVIRKSNNVFITAEVPGFRFWMSTVYKIKSASFDIDFQGIVSKEITFQLKDEDLQDFQFGKLSFAIRKYNPTAINPLTIKINDEILFDDIPTIASFSKTFGIEIPLEAGENKISFSVPKEAFYELNNVVLSIVRKV